MDDIYIDIDSQYRNKLEHPNPYDFVINYSEDILNTDSIIDTINPISDSYPIKEWSWNSHPPVTIISALSLEGDMQLDVVTNNIDFVYKVDCNSNGKGMLIYFETLPNNLTQIPALGVNSLKILAYGNNYIEGETLKINRSERYQSKSFDFLFYNQSISGVDTDFTSDLTFLNYGEFTTDEEQERFMFTPKTDGQSSKLSILVMTQGFFILPSGYNEDDTFNTSGGSGTGLTVNIEGNTSLNDYDFDVKAVNTGSGYRDGDIITVLENGSTTGSITCMLIDIRFRIGESYSLDISSIVENNLLIDNINSNIVYSHANLQPLQTVQTKTGVGSGMILQTYNLSSVNDTGGGNYYHINQIFGIFEAGQNYEIGDIVSVTDRSGNTFDFTIIPPNSSKYNKHNISQIYDNGLLTGNKTVEPQFLERKLNINEYNHTNLYGKYKKGPSPSTAVTITKFNHNLSVGELVNLEFYVDFESGISQDIMENEETLEEDTQFSGPVILTTKSTSKNVASGNYLVTTVTSTDVFTITDTVAFTPPAEDVDGYQGVGGGVIVRSGKHYFDLYNVNDKGTNEFGTKRYNTQTGIIENETYSSMNNIQGNKIYLNNSRFFGLGLYDDFYKGLFFENLTAGTKHRISGYNHTDCILTLENNVENEHTDIQNFWKIDNPSTSTKIFVPNGSDNPKEYINFFYEALVYTGRILQRNNFITESLDQSKLNNLSIDSRIVHQFRKIIDYNPISKMITLESPLLGITSHANQFNKTAPITITNIRYIHYSSETYQNGYYDLEVFPFESELYTDMSLSPTNKNASGLSIFIEIDNGRIESIGNQIGVDLAGSGYESNVESLGITSSSTYYTTQHTRGFNYTNWTTSYTN